MLRAVSVKNGEIISQVDSRKTIFSMQLDTGLYRYVSFLHLLEIEAGVSSNEPPQMAVYESIEACVYAMIMEGLINKVWRLEDTKLAQGLISKYLHQPESKEPIDTTKPAVKKDEHEANEILPELNNTPS